MNSVNLIGRLTKAPEIRYTQNNTAVTSFTLAVDNFGGKEKGADFINCVAWQKTAEFISQYFDKGTRVGLTGRIQVRKYEGKDGKTVYVTEVVAERVYFADGKGNKSSDNQSTTDLKQYRGEIEDEESEEELPF